MEGIIIEGTLGLRADKLVNDWCKENINEIKNAWHKAITGENIPWIKPLQ